MGIYKIKGYEAFCDGCECGTPFYEDEMDCGTFIASTKKETIEKLKDEGWVVRKGKVLCEDCKKIK